LQTILKGAFLSPPPNFMKTPVFPHMVALLVLSTITPLIAQNSVGTLRSFDVAQKVDDLVGESDSGFTSYQESSTRYEVPAIEKAQGSLLDSKPVYASQDALTLDSFASSKQKVESVVDLNVLRKPSPYQKVAVSNGSLRPYQIEENSLQKGLQKISAVYREAGKREKSPNCQSVSLSAGQRIKLDVSKTLEIVEAEVGANPACACEIVKTAISASDADVSLVVSIVQTAITATPENMRIISQCAIASMPESVTAVQALLAKIDPNSGNAAVYSSKSAKSAKSPKSAKVAAVSSSPNPLDRFYTPIFTPIITTKPVTDVNPSTGYRY
jgi:hypothetical protein